MQAQMTIKSFIILGCASFLFSSLSPLGPVTAAGADIPKIKVTPKNAERDGDGCITISITGKKFVGGGTEWNAYLQESGTEMPIAFGDIAPDGTLAGVSEVTICEEDPISLGKHTVTVLSTDGAGAVTKINVVDRR